MKKSNKINKQFTQTPLTIEELKAMTAERICDEKTIGRGRKATASSSTAVINAPIAPGASSRSAQSTATNNRKEGLTIQVFR